MEARTLEIEERLRDHWGRAVRPSDFKVRDGGAIDAGIVLQNPNLTLYCLDFESRQALFVETPPECDLTRVPFMYAAQYEQALRLVEVPFNTLHSLAAEVVIDPAKLILIYSVGRCGSTLVSSAYREVEGVESLSEPDVFTQLMGAWGAGNLGGDEKTELIKSCTLLQCAPGRIKNATAWALKFRSMVTPLWPLFYESFPKAKVVFLYRQAEPWARSFHRMIGGGDPTELQEMAPMRHLFGRLDPRLEPRQTASALEVMACLWLRVMEEGMEMHQQGIPMFIVRYEELRSAPQEVLAHLFAYSGLPHDASDNLDAVLGQDSQAGSAISRESLGEAPAQLTAEHLKELRRLIQEVSPEWTADRLLPGTYFPARQDHPSAS
jgi:hypothetical protein